jgi:integrase
MQGNGAISATAKVPIAPAGKQRSNLNIGGAAENLDHRTIYIPDAKGGPRRQPITGQLVAFLEGHMAGLQRGTPWLFPSLTAKNGHTADIRKPFRRVVSAAGLNPEEVVRYTLRHTAITHFVQAGVDLPTVKRISGHKTLTMVERYAHQNGEHINSDEQT